MSRSEDVAALSIGSVVGGPTSSNQLWKPSLWKLQQQVVASRARTKSPLNVNVVFHVPGDVVQPDFVGVRTARYSKRDNLLMVQVALPEEPPLDPFEYLVDLVAAAVRAAESWAQKRKIASDLAVLDEIVVTLAA